MSSKRRVLPRMVFAGPEGEIYDHPELLMLCRRGAELTLPRPDEIMPLPPESEFFLLPGREAVGLDPETGRAEGLDGLALAAFVSPGHTLTGVAAYRSLPDAPRLPLFAYAAVGFAEDRFWVCARKVDEDRRQVFQDVPPEKIRRGASDLLARYPKNRLVRHLTGCALTTGCPAAKNLALGRFEAPLPTSRTCNARCVGCISEQPDDSGFPATQCRIGFTPTAEEVVEVMLHHASRERRAILSFGQGCEGEPLTEAPLLEESIRRFRAAGGRGTVNLNTNASRPETLAPLAAAGLDSIRASMNSARPEVYAAYYRPKGFDYAQVAESVAEAKRLGLHTALNYLFFPGVSDTENELAALSALVESTKLDLIQLRNLNLDPEYYLSLTDPFDHGPSMGFLNFKKRLKKAFPWLEFGYFNPYVEPRS